MASAHEELKSFTVPPHEAHRHSGCSAAGQVVGFIVLMHASLIGSKKSEGKRMNTCFWIMPRLGGEQVKKKRNTDEKHKSLDRIHPPRQSVFLHGAGGYVLPVSVTCMHPAFFFHLFKAERVSSTNLPSLYFPSIFCRIIHHNNRPRMVRQRILRNHVQGTRIL